MEMINVAELFGSDVFNDKAMRERLPKAVYKSLRRTIDASEPLDPALADVVAAAMKDWAVEKGATHFTHWFQPMTDITAEKHDSFISPTGDGAVILEFSGKELIQGEPDASSFPSGGLRSTFEARGYTAWDCTSPAFVKDGTLYIPTAFCSYTGEALDKKTPLLRSMDALSRQAMRILKVFGIDDARRVVTTVGPEQEYFLIDKEMFDARKDLIYTGRTLFGAAPPKGQELEDQYFTTLKERVSAFMHELDVELWRLGVPATTKHNEVAPAQHELAPVFSSANIATDHNQLVMETMKKVALHHGLRCLLHEKPFAGVNGSGKHNNWSMATDTGVNLLDPGDTPHENAQFLVFLSAVLWAVDEYAEILRASTANPGNDHRLGANEAPPAIVSVFLGDQLTQIMEKLSNGGKVSSNGKSFLRIGVSTLPSLPKDATDRNRTSPFAFTGNKFEFRMVGSSASIAGPNFVLNTIVAEILGRVADRLEGADDLDASVQTLVAEVWNAHKRVVFNGDGYCAQWLAEAARRELPNITSSVAAIQVMEKEENVRLFEKHGVLTPAETHSRMEVLLEHYARTIRIEALTMLEMAGRQILPAAMSYAAELAGGINAVADTGAGADMSAQIEILRELSALCSAMQAAVKTLRSAVGQAAAEDCVKARAEAYRDVVVAAMNELRGLSDAMEIIVDEEFWPLPSYGDILFRV